MHYMLQHAMLNFPYVFLICGLKVCQLAGAPSIYFKNKINNKASPLCCQKYPLTHRLYGVEL